MESTRVGGYLESSRNVKKTIGIRPQALIINFKTKINHENSKNTITNARKSDKTLHFLPPIETL